MVQAELHAARVSSLSLLNACGLFAIKVASQKSINNFVRNFPPGGQQNTLSQVANKHIKASQQLVVMKK